MITIISPRRSLDRSTHDLISRRRLDVRVTDSVPKVAAAEGGGLVTFVDGTPTLDALLEQLAADADCVILFGPQSDGDLTVADVWNAGEAGSPSD